MARFGIDLTAAWRKRTGMSAYAVSLARALLELDTENEYMLFFSGRIAEELIDLSGRFEAWICPSRNRLYAEFVWLPWIARKSVCDLVHFPNFAPSPLFRGRIVMTVTDTLAWSFPANLSWKGYLYAKSIFHWGAKRSELIFTISNSAKRDIVTHMGIPEERVVTTYLAPANVFSESTSLEAVREKYGLPKVFALSVCSLEPRKNLERLVRAWGLISDKLPADYQLILVGRQSRSTQNILRAIRDVGKSRVRILGHVPTRDLTGLYRLATLFVFPSLYEGFGLPVVEAMASGCPVIASTASSLPEIAGEAAILVDPLDTQAIGRAILELLESERTRAKLIAQGRDRAQSFSWKKAAQQTLSGYYRVLGLPNEIGETDVQSQSAAGEGNKALSATA